MGWIFGLPQGFILIGVIFFLLPKFLWWMLITRPKERRIARQRELNGLFWRIRDLEMDIYGEWKS